MGALLTGAREVNAHLNTTTVATLSVNIMIGPKLTCVVHVFLS